MSRGERERDEERASRGGGERGERHSARSDTGGASATPEPATEGAAGGAAADGRVRPKRGWWKPLLAAAALLLVLYALRVPILVRVARAVEVHQPPVHSDVIFLLGGDDRMAGRAQHAASLYRRGFARQVVMARSEDPPAAFLGFYPNDTDVDVAILRHSGVPDSAIAMIVVPGGATSTTDEGRLLAWYLRRHPADRVLMVTSEYHTRRARWALRRGLHGVQVEVRVSGARDPRFHAGNWWRSEEGLLAYFSEYVKWGHNVLYR